MRRPVLARLMLFGLAALCTGTRAEGAAAPAADALFPGPSTVIAAPPPPLATAAPPPAGNWYGLLRRSLGHAVALAKRAEGIRTEQDAQKLDLEAWSRDTVHACAQRLAQVAATTPTPNQAGVAGCWNLPLLVESTGVFAADLRLFRVAAPSGDWKDVDVSSYNISVKYDGGAAIQPRNMTAKERVASEEGMKGSNLTKLVDSQFIGNLDRALITAQLSDTQLKVMVTPEISIQAVSKQGNPISAAVSIDQSKFLNGVFADTPNLDAQQSEDVKDPVFKIPGTRIEIVPAGLYFYSAYLVVACAIYGWGTLERAKFRDQYRRRIATQGFR